MLRVLAICFVVLVTPIHSGPAEKLGRFSNSSALFTTSGESLSVALAGRTLQLEITPLAKAPIKLQLSLDKTEFGGLSLLPWRVCGISVSASNRVAAIGVPSAVGSESRRGVFVALVDLETNQWGKQYFVELSDRPASIPHFLGFLGDSEALAAVAETSYSPTNLSVVVLDVCSGKITRRVHDPRSFALGTRFFFDPGNGRVWLAFERPDKLGEGQNPSILQSITLTAEQGPEIRLADLHAQHASTKWLIPQTMAFPTGATLVFAETGWNAGFPPNRLWKTDLATTSIRAMNLPLDVGKALVHGLGFGWYEDVGEPNALSPDGRFLVIEINLTALGPPYFVDNYVSKGSRLAIVDLQAMRVVTSVKPEHDRHPVGFAVDHRDGKIVLLVNWDEGWKRTELPESR